MNCWIYSLIDMFKGVQVKNQYLEFQIEKWYA